LRCGPGGGIEPQIGGIVKAQPIVIATIGGAQIPVPARQMIPAQAQRDAEIILAQCFDRLIATRINLRQAGGQAAVGPAFRVAMGIGGIAIGFHIVAERIGRVEPQRDARGLRGTDGRIV
jgi:hypothetical protein